MEPFWHLDLRRASRPRSSRSAACSSYRAKVIATVLLLLGLIVGTWGAAQRTSWFGPWVSEGIGRVIGADRWR